MIPQSMCKIGNRAPWFRGLLTFIENCAVNQSDNAFISQDQMLEVGQNDRRQSGNQPPPDKFPAEPKTQLGVNQSPVRRLCGEQMEGMAEKFFPHQEQRDRDHSCVKLPEPCFAGGTVKFDETRYHQQKINAAIIDILAGKEDRKS